MSSAPASTLLPQQETPRERAVFWILFGVIAAMVVWLVLGPANRIGKLGDPNIDRFRDFLEFHAAAQAAAEGGNIYQVGFYGYLYPPLLAAFLSPLGKLPIGVAAWVWLGVKATTLVACLWLGATTLRDELRLTRKRWHLAAVTLIGLFLVMDKVRIEMNMQQSNLLLLLAFILGLRWSKRRPWLAGLAMGLGANIKYLTLVGVPYMLWRGRWRAAMHTVLWAGIWALVPALILGWARNMSYLETALGGLTGTVHAQQAVANRGVPPATFGVSLPAWAARATEQSGHPGARLLLLAVPAFLLTASLLVAYVDSGVKFLGRPFREERPETDAIIAVEWSLLIVVLLAMGPQTNSPHLSMLLLPAMAAAAWVMEPGRPGKRAVLIASIILWLGLIFPPTMRGTEHLKGLWRGVSGAAWCMLPLIPALLYGVLRHRETPEPVDQ